MAAALPARSPAAVPAPARALRVAYLVHEAPLPLTAGIRLRFYANWKALACLAETRLIVLGDESTLPVRRALKGAGAILLPRRREPGWRKNLRFLVAGLRGESMRIASYMSPRRQAKLLALLAAEKPDVIVLGDLYMSALIPLLRPLGARIVVDNHNAESRLTSRIVAASRSPGKKLSYALVTRNVRMLERTFLPMADGLWAVSEPDADFYRDLLAGASVAVIPNAIDLGEPADAAAIEPGTIVYVGFYGYFPNQDAGLRLIAMSKALRAKGVAHRVFLVGRGPTAQLAAAAAGEAQIVITGEVPDMAPYLARAAIFAAPLHAGSGTKFKVLQAMAAGRAVLTTPIGAEGLAFASGSDGVVADDDAEFLAALQRLLADPEGCRAMGRRARAWVEARFSWRALPGVMTPALPGFDPARPAPAPEAVAAIEAAAAAVAAARG